MIHEYTKDLSGLICADIACGMSVEKACKNSGISDRAFYLWLAKYPELVQEYARARDIRADSRFESSAQLMEDLRNDVIDVNKARVMLDEIKWKCGKESAKKYGESTTIKGDKDNPIEIKESVNKELLAILTTDQLEQIKMKALEKDSQ